jgi:hypothetical protein
VLLTGAVRFCSTVIIVGGLVFFLSLPTVAQTPGDLQRQCDNAFAEYRWTDVVDFCSRASSTETADASRLQGLTDADKLSIYEVIVDNYCQVAFGYDALGNLEKAKEYIALARASLSMATALGLSKSSAEYNKLLKHMDDLSNIIEAQK